jgi:hypothetical protein
VHPVSKQIQTFETDQKLEIPAGIRKVLDSVSRQDRHPSPGNIFIRSKAVKLELANRLPVDCTLESAAVVYNMALCYHLKDTTISKQRAMVFYDMALNLCSSLATGQMAVTIVMGSLNNAGQILHSVGEYAASRKYMETLRQYIVKLPLPYDSQSMEERYECLLNAVLLRPPCTAGAA